MNGFFSFWREAARIVFHLIYDIRFEGTEHISHEKGYIIACNHVTFFDPIILTFRVPKPVRYLAKEELFDNFWIGWVVKGLGAVRVARGTGDTTAIEACAALAQKNEIIGIFPEGTRSPNGQPQRPKSGMALIARLTGYDVLPCAVVLEQPLRFRSRITVRYGVPIAAEALALQDPSPRALKRATKLVWQQILTLGGFVEVTENG